MIFPLITLSPVSFCNQSHLDEFCPRASCQTKSEECWELVAEYTKRGSIYASQSTIGDAVECFVRAANAVQDERYTLKHLAAKEFILIL